MTLPCVIAIKVIVVSPSLQDEINQLLPCYTRLPTDSLPLSPVPNKGTHLNSPGRLRLTLRLLQSKSKFPPLKSNEKWVGYQQIWLLSLPSFTCSCHVQGEAWDEGIHLPMQGHNFWLFAVFYSHTHTHTHLKRGQTTSHTLFCEWW